LIPILTTWINQKRWLDEIAENKDAKARVVEGQSDSPAAMVWSAMTQMYGEAWIKKYGEKPNPVWTRMLKDIPLNRIQRGLRRTVEASSDFPPSLPKFAEYCSRIFGEESSQKALPPRTKTNRETALEHLAEVKSILGVV